MIVFILFCFANQVSSWGGDGHRIITELALRQMSLRAKAFLATHFGTGNDGPVKASTWADTVEAELAYPGSAAYHFCNTPYRKCGEFKIERDCGNGAGRVCIVTALVDAISNSLDTDGQTRTDALKFIIHLIGDIHQPLHVGFRSDAGGVRIKLGKPTGTDLHAIWDSWLISKHISTLRPNSWKKFVDLLDESSSGGAAASLSSDRPSSEVLLDREAITEYIASIATETATEVTCVHGYTDSKGDYIRGMDTALNEKEFYESKMNIVKQQLTRGSRRLVEIIEALASEVYSRRETAKLSARRVIKKDIFTTVVPRSDSVDSRFGALEFEFDQFDDSSEPISTTVAPSTARVRAKVRKPKKIVTDDFAVLDEAIAFNMANRNMEIFNGIDLQHVRSVVRSFPDGQQFHFVTDGKLLDRIPDYNSRRVFPFRVYLLSPIDGDLHLEKFLFDVDFFDGPDKMLTDEVMIRTLLKISNKDCTIDISDYLHALETCSSSKSEFLPARRPADSLMAHHLVPELQRNRTARKEALMMSVERKQKFPFSNALRALEYEIAVFMEGRVIAYFLPFTFASNTTWARANMMTIVMTRSETMDPYFFLIDSNIYEGCLDPTEMPGLEAKLLEYTQSVSKRLQDRLLRFRPSFSEELKAINYLLLTEDSEEVVRESVNRSAIDEFILYPDPDPREQLTMIEWNRRLI